MVFGVVAVGRRSREPGRGGRALTPAKAVCYTGAVSGAKLRIDLYTKADCCLCDEVKAVLRRVARDYPLEIVETDIAADPALRARYGEEIPVVWIEGRKAFKYRVDEGALRRRLDRALFWRRLTGRGEKKEAVP